MGDVSVTDQPITLGTVAPDRARFHELAAHHRVIPVVRRLLADDETPVGVYRKLAGRRTGTFLLESAAHGESWSRFSFIGAQSAAALTERGGRAHWTGTPPVGPPGTGDDATDAPLVVLRETLERLRSDPLPGLPPLTGGLVGYVGYDAVRRLERLGAPAGADLELAALGEVRSTDPP